MNIFHGDDNGVVNVLESHPTLPVLATSGTQSNRQALYPSYLIQVPRVICSLYIRPIYFSYPE